MAKINGTVYFLKFDAPLGDPATHQAEWYIGFAEDGNLDARLDAHRKGQGAAITRALWEKGIGFQLVATVEGDRNLERSFKRQHHTARIVRHLLKTRKVQ